MTQSKILIVEDEPNISNGLKIILEEENYQITICATGLSAIPLFQTQDLVLLDLMLPDISGFDVLKTIRDKDALLPVIILSAKNREEDIVSGLSLGADDYVTKPFSLEELKSRIRRALNRRALSNTAQPKERTLTPFHFGKELSIDFNKLTATNKKTVIALTRQECEILHYLVERSGQVVGRDQLTAHLWGRDHEYESRTIDNFMVRFRKYFEENPRRPKHFITKRGAGYLFMP